MMIGIDARMYGKESRGIGRYIEELIKNLEQIDTQNKYYIFLHSNNFNEYNPQNPNFQKILAPYRWYSLAEQIYFPKLLKQYNLDLMHFPHFNVPLFYNKPFIVTIHDLILIKESQKKATTLGPLIYFIKKIAYKIVIKHAVKNAKKIISVSDWTKKDLEQIFKISPQKIQTIYNGLSTLAKQNQNDKTNVLGYNISNPYLLYVGSAYPHKNLDFLLETFKKINVKENWDLVFVGKKDFFYERLEQLAKKKNIENVKFLDFINDNDLANLYKNCLAFVFPSKYEGFGLPGLEAMANFACVLSSNASCLPEIYNNAALYFDPNSQDDLLNKLQIISKDENLRKNLVANGLERTKIFNWQKTALNTKNLYISNA